jgi:hypothetical protein
MVLFCEIKEVMLPSAATVHVQLHLFFLPDEPLPAGAVVGDEPPPPPPPPVPQAAHVTATALVTAVRDPEPSVSQDHAAVAGIWAGCV